MKNTTLALIASLTLASCASTPEELEAGARVVRDVSAAVGTTPAGFPFAVVGTAVAGVMSAAAAVMAARAKKGAVAQVHLERDAARVEHGEPTSTPKA